MKKFKIFVYLNLIALLLLSCGKVKEGFINQKKNSSDEFLVEKKSPLVMPPDFDELPSPDIKNTESNFKKNSIKELLTENKSTTNSNEKNTNLESSILDKIKNK